MSVPADDQADEQGQREAVRRAAEAVRSADALLVTAGAGMGVDSGLPDFRGTQGFWRAYPPYQPLGLRFEQIASPDHFAEDPAVGWGFYGHRLNLYRATGPHLGFDTLLRWAASRRAGMAACFVFTSNVDGHFQRAGFPPEQVVECHGSLHHLQCTRPCTSELWPADTSRVTVDERTMRAEEPLPRCPRCGRVGRPNVLMFGDWGWVGHRTEEQTRRYQAWLNAHAKSNARLVVIECGAGTAIPTVRRQSEMVAAARGAALIRINPTEPQGPGGTIGLAMAARQALERIQRLIDTA
jgi:NAD-dependent SIR2 family protein deacetylase